MWPRLIPVLIVGIAAVQAPSPHHSVHAQRDAGAGTTHGVLVERNIAAPMRDGVMLRADIYRPDTGSIPCPPAAHPVFEGLGRRLRTSAGVTWLCRRHSGFERTIHVRRHGAAAR
jgi:predicted acyl esterase